MYTIMKGHFPHGSRDIQTYEEEEEYNERVKQLLADAQFPDVSEISIGDAIAACWKSDITAITVRNMLQGAIPAQSTSGPVA